MEHIAPTQPAKDALSTKELSVIRSIFLAAGFGTILIGIFDGSDALVTPWDDWWIPFNSVMYIVSALVMFIKPKKQTFAILLSFIPTAIYQQGVLFWAVHFPGQESYYSAASSGPFFPIVYLALFIILPRYAMLLSCIHCSVLFLQWIGNTFYFWLNPGITTALTAEHLLTAVLCSHPAYIVALRYIVTLREHLSATQKEAFESKSRFLGMLSHEIKNFLQGLLATVDLLEFKAKSLEDRKLIGQIATQTEQLNTYLSDVLALNRLENPSLNVNLAPVPLNALLNEIHSSWQARFLARHLHLNLAITPDLGALTVKTDRTRLRQVIENLLSNAMKYTPTGCVTVGLFLDNTQKAYAVIEVKDTGIGISITDQKSIFEPYIRLKHANEICSEGSGLGLAIASRIMPSLGGSISVESELGQGSIFRVRLPLE